MNIVPEKNVDSSSYLIVKVQLEESAEIILAAPYEILLEVFQLYVYCFYISPSDSRLSVTWITVAALLLELIKCVKDHWNQ